MLAKWNGKLIAVSCLLNLTPLGLPHIKKHRHWHMVKSTWKSEFHPSTVFSTRAQGSVMPTKNFALSRIIKDELIKLFKSENNSHHQRCRWLYVGR